MIEFEEPLQLMLPLEYTEYCPKCKQETPHQIVNDNIFDDAMECLVCHIVWMMEPFFIKLKHQW